MGELILLADTVAAIGILLVAYFFYRKFLAPGLGKDKIQQDSYEEGFSDAVMHFGLKKLYQEDTALHRRMEEVFGEAGITHRISSLLEGARERAGKE